MLEESIPSLVKTVDERISKALTVARTPKETADSYQISSQETLLNKPNNEVLVLPSTELNINIASPTDAPAFLDKRKRPEKTYLR